MARIRTIKPEFFQNEELATCSAHARLLAIALLQLVDSEGRMRWISSQVKAHAFPWETIDISPMIHQLCTVKYLRIYRVDGREYADIPTFTKHQRLTGKEASQKSKFPPYEQSLTDGKEKGKTERFPGKHLDAQEQGTGNREQDINPLSLVHPLCDEVVVGPFPEITELPTWIHDRLRVSGIPENYIDHAWPIVACKLREQTSPQSAKTWASKFETMMVRGYRNGWDKPPKDKPHGTQQSTTSRTQRVVDELDRIAREDIEQNGFVSTLGH